MLKPIKLVAVAATLTAITVAMTVTPAQATLGWVFCCDVPPAYCSSIGQSYVSSSGGLYDAYSCGASPNPSSPYAGLYLHRTR